MNYTPVIGLEVHVELKTKSKMFCGCSADYFGKEPNTHTCPVCLGLPGALPVPNKRAIEWCMMIGMALNCKIAEFSKFDRKNYFYPDLPKGFQISQYDLPFGNNGLMKLQNGKTIRIRRVHMEEDTAKLSHQLEAKNNEFVSLIDFNRSGIALVEIVTEPDFHDAFEVKEYLQKLQQIVRYLDVSNADMEKGDMRLEPNISLKPVILASETRPESKTDAGQASMTNDELPNYKVEVKNINSFRFVEKAIEYEIKRQTEIFEKGETPVQETRGWNENKAVTFSQRVKEEANDYRYFPEPDIPPFRFSKEDLESLQKQLPELPNQTYERFQKEFGLSSYDAEILSREKPVADVFEKTVEKGKTENITVKQIANVIINKRVDPIQHTVDQIIAVVKSSTQTVQLDVNELNEIIEKVLKENEKAVQDYKSGKESAIMFLVGQVMRSLGKRVDTQIVKESLLSKLK
ncbi:MAG TPA: Asp-tRNA(Asn)/Glu-tRNA(Gln) amidotransferase subunit GatB [Patescibacteria group bacterium]|nr:Asp-tRNA(Asn)/Glu-tRNA(Gln) amidotransferase subunit GatB [Patescibacteria group bacterium]